MLGFSLLFSFKKARKEKLAQRNVKVRFIAKKAQPEPMEKRHVRLEGIKGNVRNELSLFH